jgi:hypothetical protein
MGKLTGNLFVFLQVMYIVNNCFSLCTAYDKSEDVLYNSVDMYDNLLIEPIFNVSSLFRSVVLAKLLRNFEEQKLRGSNSFGEKCGVQGLWRQIAYFDTKRGDPCPPGLHMITNTVTNQSACGTSHDGPGCTSVFFPICCGYSKVCGIVRGYQFASPDAFDTTIDASQSIDTYYVDGISITQGSPRKHLWTYATGLSELNRRNNWRCPCSRANPNDRTDIPDFVGEHYYCETAFPGTSFQHGVVRWDDPLWDGKGCVSPSNKCCERYGWFYRNISSSSDGIELRSCQDQNSADEDTLIENYEFWVSV